MFLNLIELLLTGSTTRRQLSTSRQASSNASEGGINRESSLDDSGVVDDHDDQDNTNTELVNASTVEVHNIWTRSFVPF